MFMTAPNVRMNRLAHSWSNGRAAGRHSNGQPGSHSSKCLSVVMESSTPQNPTARKKKHTHTRIPVGVWDTLEGRAWSDLGLLLLT